MIFLWTLFALQLRLSCSAYVQVKQCDHFSGPASWASASFEAFLSPGKSQTNLSLHVFDPASFDQCETNSATANISVNGYSTHTYSPAIDGPCASSRHAEGNSSFNIRKPALYLSQDIENLHPLSTFLIDVRLHASNETSDTACLSAYITPEIPRRVRDALFYGPLAVLVVVLVMTYCRVLLEERDVLVEGQIDHKPPVVTGIGYCLQHLQFVFLSACLSLSYPGFFQPAVSSLNWFSLFSSSNAFLGGYRYAGIADGIYETNGTYGGTFGMEHMIQVLGAPMTIEVWINMTILILLMLAAAAILIWLHRLLYRRLHPPSEYQQSTTMQQLIADTLRIVLSYFVQPIIAISAYQLANIGLLPTYLISLSVLLIVIVLAAYVWLFRNTSAERLAVLYIDMPETDRGTHTYQRNLRVHLVVQFSMSVLRGIAIGAAQASGSGQIALMMLCEAVSIVSVVKFIPQLRISTVTICASGRFVILALMIVFAVPTASFSSRCSAAYAILALELIILIMAILVPQIYAFVKLWRLRIASEKAPVYNLRQLQRRSYQARQLPQRPGDGYQELTCVNCGLNPTLRSDSARTLRFNAASIPLRHLRDTAPGTTRTAISSSRPSSSFSRDETLHGYGSHSHAASGCYSSELSDKRDFSDVQSHRSVSGGSYASLPSSESFVLPNADYETREIDLYYREPRRPSFRAAARNSSIGFSGVNFESISQWFKTKWHPSSHKPESRSEAITTSYSARRMYGGYKNAPNNPQLNEEYSTITSLSPTRRRWMN